MAAKLYRMVYSTSSGFKCTRYFTRLQGDKATVGAKDVVDSLMAESQARGATEIFARIQQFEADKGEFKPCAEDLLFNWPDTKEEPEVVTPPAKTVTAAAKAIAGKPADEPKLENKGKWAEQGIIYPVTGEPNQNGLVLPARGTCAYSAQKNARNRQKPRPLLRGLRKKRLLLMLGQTRCSMLCCSAP